MIWTREKKNLTEAWNGFVALVKSTAKWGLGIMKDIGMWRVGWEKSTRETRDGVKEMWTAISNSYTN